MLETSGPVPAFTDAVQARDVNRIAGLLAHDVRLSVPPLHYTRLGTQDVIDALVDLLRCFDDLRYDVRSRYVAPGTVTDETMVLGRQIAPFLGAEPGRGPVAVPARVIVAHDAATITGITVWPDVAALRAVVGGASRVIDLTRVGDAGAMVARLRATIPPARSRLIIGTARQERPPAPPPVAVALGPPVAAEPGPLAGRAVPKPPVPRQVRRRRAMLAGGAMAVASAALTIWVAVGALSQVGPRPAGGTVDVSPLTSPVGPARSPGAEVAPSGNPAGTGAGGAPAGRGTNSTLADADPTRLAVDRTEVSLSSDVLFDTDSARLKPDARALLDGLVADARQQRRHGLVTVSGYTDDRGTRAYNLALSRRRAATVAAHLRNGLARTGMTLTSHGYGIDDPIASNGTAAGRRLNRRVTIEFPRAQDSARAVTPRPDAGAA